MCHDSRIDLCTILPFIVGKVNCPALSRLSMSNLQFARVNFD